MALVAVTLVSAAERYHIKPVSLKPGTELSDSVPAGSPQWTFHCRIEPPKTAHHPLWDLLISDPSGTERTIRLERKGMKAADSDYEPDFEVTVTASDGSVEKHFVIDRDIDPSADGWSLMLEKLSGSDSVICSVGQRTPLAEFALPATDEQLILTLVPRTEVGLSRMSLISEAPSECGVARFGSVSELEAYLAESKDGNECLWRYLDRNTDQRLLNLGGDYRLATVRRDDGNGYDIVYLEGARVNSSFWKPLMIKGRLTSTPFAGHYDLLWYDSYGHTVDRDANASIESGSILTLNFPLQGGTVRFALSPSR